MISPQVSFGKSLAEDEVPPITDEELGLHILYDGTKDTSLSEAGGAVE